MAQDGEGWGGDCGTWARVFGLFVEEVGVVLGFGWEGHDGLLVWQCHDDAVYLLVVSWLKLGNIVVKYNSLYGQNRRIDVQARAIQLACKSGIKIKWVSKARLELRIDLIDRFK